MNVINTIFVLELYQTTWKNCFEYRKRIFKERIESVVVYSTRPVGKIIGEFLIDEILTDSPVKLWEKTNKYSGISKDFFMDYFNNRDHAFALKIKRFIEYENPLDPYEVIENFVPPQSFMYIEDDFFTTQCTS